MDLIAFSIRTKGVHNFARRLWTVFTRFGITRARTRRALYAIVNTARRHGGAPTFFIPAVVLRRHASMLETIADEGAEIGIHGYVHNDYRTLSASEQLEQTKLAAGVFHSARLSPQGFRNPYLGWTQDSLRVFAAVGLVYDSNEAVIHDVIDQSTLSPRIRSGYEKSLELFQAIPCTTYTVRPHFEGNLLRLPTSIPDDEMLFDRLRITDAHEVGRIWCEVMRRVYELGGMYALNLHPERGLLCRDALDMLLSYARGQPLPVWLVRLQDLARWWKERRQFSLAITPLDAERWHIHTVCSPRATLLVRHATVEEPSFDVWGGGEVRVRSHDCIIRAQCWPGIALSPQTPVEVAHFLREQGYPVAVAAASEPRHSLYLDVPQGLGTTHEEQLRTRSGLIEQIEQLETPLIWFGCWPYGSRAALAITSDIDSVTVQDFFLRVVEVASITRRVASREMAL